MDLRNSYAGPTPPLCSTAGHVLALHSILLLGRVNSQRCGITRRTLHACPAYCSVKGCANFTLNPLEQSKEKELCMPRFSLVSVFSSSSCTFADTAYQILRFTAYNSAFLHFAGSSMTQMPLISASEFKRAALSCTGQTPTWSPQAAGRAVEHTLLACRYTCTCIYCSCFDAIAIKGRTKARLLMSEARGRGELYWREATMPGCGSHMSLER